MKKRFSDELAFYSVFEHLILNKFLYYQNYIENKNDTISSIIKFYPWSNSLKEKNIEINLGVGSIDKKSDNSQFYLKGDNIVIAHMFFWLENQGFEDQLSVCVFANNMYGISFVIKKYCHLSAKMVHYIIEGNKFIPLLHFKKIITELDRVFNVLETKFK